MTHKEQKNIVIPSIEQVEAERKRLHHNKLFKRTLRSTVAILIVVAAIAILIATLLFPVLQIYGSSMSPVLKDGEIVVLTKTSDFKTGDIVAFYYNNKILVKRVICGAGDWIDMDEDGNVFVNGTKIDEPYITDKSIGQCDMKFPYQIPDESYFVMGDHRSVSIDSRSSQVGCVRTEQVVGHVLFRIWPLTEISWIS